MTSSFVLPLLRHKGKVSRSSARDSTSKILSTLLSSFRMDGSPLQPNRVWVYNRQEGVHVKDFVGVKTTGKSLCFPQSLHMDLTKTANAEFGFYTVDRNQGNWRPQRCLCILWRPLPFRGKPYKRSLQRRLLEGATGIANRFKSK
jgi:hypothetical protein